MAKVILGGQLLSLLLSLLITPVAYSIWDDITRILGIARNWKRKAKADPPALEPEVALETVVDSHVRREDEVLAAPS